jgi:2-keto-3-deoxy-L-arabinonate dehydratase
MMLFRQAYARWLPLINHENRPCGWIAAKILVKANGIIDCDDGRHPLRRPHPAAEAALLELAGELDAMVLRWA